jgi:hypothetical protein
LRRRRARERESRGGPRQVCCAFRPIGYIKPDQPVLSDSSLGQGGKPRVFDHGND